MILNRADFSISEYQYRISESMILIYLLFRNYQILIQITEIPDSDNNYQFNYWSELSDILSKFQKSRIQNLSIIYLLTKPKAKIPTITERITGPEGPKSWFRKTEVLVAEALIQRWTVVPYQRWTVVPYPEGPEVLNIRDAALLTETLMTCHQS